MSQRELLQIPVDVTAHPETAERWDDLRHAVATELECEPDELSKWEVLREAAEAYTGQNGCGRWKND